MYFKGLLGKVVGAFLGVIALLLSAQVLAETPDLVTALSSVDIKKEKFDSDGVVKLVAGITAHSREMSESKKLAVGYYCRSDVLNEKGVDLTLGVAEFAERKRKRHESLGKCYRAILSVYKEQENKSDDIKKKIKPNRERLEAIYKESREGIIEKNIYIKADNIPAQLFSNKEASRKVSLSEYFSLREKVGKNKADDDRKIHAPLSFSIQGCEKELNEDDKKKQEDNVPAADDIGHKDADKSSKNDQSTEDSDKKRILEARIKALKENLAGNMPVICSVDEAGVLTLSPKSSVSGYRDLEITASYTENDVIVEKHAFLPVKVSSFKAQGCSAWNCQSHYSFLLGVEGTNMSEVKKETILRYEFASYHMLNDNVHMFGRIFQTSTPDEGSCEGEAEDCEEELIEAITADIGGNYLFWESPRANEDGKQVLRGGLTAQYGIYKSGNADRDFAEYYYSGIRFAHHKQRYFDILYGKREDLLGRRVKFKGQVPVYNDNFVVGVEIEVAGDGEMRRAGLSNRDSIKAFVLYQVDFAGFIKR